MTDALRTVTPLPCPFCGAMPLLDRPVAPMFAVCQTPRCPGSPDERIPTVGEWNTRAAVLDPAPNWKEDAQQIEAIADLIAERFPASAIRLRKFAAAPRAGEVTACLTESELAELREFAAKHCLGHHLTCTVPHDAIDKLTAALGSPTAPLEVTLACSLGKHAECVMPEDCECRCGHPVEAKP